MYSDQRDVNATPASGNPTSVSVMPFRLTFARFLPLWLALCAAARAQDPGPVIRLTEWGFDGKAVQQRFTPLSVLVENPTANPIEGKLQLTKAVQLTTRIDAVYEQDYYVSPFSQRWVQFTPFVIDDWESWTLAWGTARDQKMEIPTPRVGERATVLIYNPEDVNAVGGVLRRFDEALFPVSVTGTDTLRGVVFDRVPDWQGAREQAFLDWLRCGGRVYLLLDRDGQYPRFPTSLEALNNPQDRFRVGGGLVRRVALQARDVDYDAAQTILIDSEQQRAPESLREPLREYGVSGTMGWDRDRQIFLDLEQLARFHRRWWLIYLAVLAYLLAMFPGCYLVGRRAPDWRMFYAAFLGAAMVFSLAFNWLGQVGGGETSRVRSVALAQQVENGLYNVTQWSSAAAVHGDVYDIHHGGSGRIYSTCQEIEAVQGVIGGGRLVVDMPPASTRTLLHRVRLTGPSLGLVVRDALGGDGDLQRFSARTGAAFPSQVDFACACYQGKIYRLSTAGGILTLGDRGQAGLMFLNTFFNIDWGMTARGTPRVQKDAEDSLLTEQQRMFRSMMTGLIGNSFGLSTKVRPEELMLGPDVVRVFVFSPMPAEFFAQGDAFTDQRGYVLYVVDLPVTGGR